MLSPSRDGSCSWLFRTIFAQPDRDAVSAAWEEVRDQPVKTFSKVGPLMDAAKVEVLAFTAFPKAVGARKSAHVGRPANARGRGRGRSRRRILWVSVVARRGREGAA